MTHPVSRTILLRQLHYRRRVLRISRADIAAHLGVTHDMVTKWELGYNVPRNDQLLNRWDQYLRDEEIRLLRFLARIHPTEIPDVSNDVAVTHV